MPKGTEKVILSGSISDDRGKGGDGDGGTLAAVILNHFGRGKG